MQEKVRIGVGEDRFTGSIESQTSKIPSSGYLAAAFGAITASAILKIVGKDDWALFVGQWPAAFLVMGVYNKMAQMHTAKLLDTQAGPRVASESRGRVGPAE